MKKELVKILTVFIVTVGAVVFGLNYLFLSGETPIKSRAVDESKVTLWFDPASPAPAANADFIMTAKVKGTAADVIMRGYDMKYTFDKAKFQVKKIEYKLGTMVADLGNGDADITQINSSGTFHIMGEINTSIGQIVTTTGTDVAAVTFTAVSASQASITVVSKFYTTNADYTISENVITAPVSIDVNGGGGVTGSRILNLKLKYQGITTKPADALNSMNIKFKVSGCGLAAPVESTGKFVADNSGIWTGQVGFNLSACTTSNYIVFVKGPRHLQKKICDATPTETAVGTYRCGEGKINIVAGANTFDFSGIVLLSGDIDQNGTVDSADISFIRNNLGKTDAATLAKCDINLDGKCDTQDYSLVIFALSMKVDET